jgi:CRP/FNR family transcriptional regulator, cyclic AMP receptor protein
MNNFFWSNLFKHKDSEINTIADYWSNTPLFKDIPLRHIIALSENMHIRNYQQGEIVFREGDQSAGVILVLEGQVKIMALDTPISVLDQGDFFGEIALAENDKRTADAVCARNCRLVFFLKQDLEEWIEVEHYLGLVFLKNLSSTLAKRLHQANLLLADKAGN